MSTNTPKLIPFDLNIALKHPERVRFKDWQTAIRVAHFPEAHANWQVVILFEHDSAITGFTTDGRFVREEAPVLFLTAETKFVPWPTIDEVPEGVYFKRKAISEIYVATGFAPVDNLIFLRDRWYSPAELFHDWEYSPNRNGPWLPCGKEVAT